MLSAQSTDTTQSWPSFQQAYTFKNAYIVFAGPYPASPSSSFGHLFLLLEPDRSPDVPLLLWNAVNFAAVTKDVGPFGKFYKGLFGGLTGQLDFLPFYEKLRDYTFIESRALWMFPIELTEVEADSLLKNLYRRNKVGFPYRFFSNNCASQIGQVLQKSIDPENGNAFSGRSPRKVLQKFAAKLKEPLYVESMQDKLERLRELENSREEQFANDAIHYTENTEEAKILLNLMEWRAFRKSEHLDDESKQNMNRLRVLLSKTTPQRTDRRIANTKPFNMHPPIKLGGGLKFQDQKIEEYLIQFRLGIHEFADRGDVFLRHDFFSLMQGEIAVENKKMRLNQLWLFKQLSIAPNSYIRKYKSWQLAAGTSRKFELPGNPLATGLLAGYGWTKSAFSQRLNSTIMLNVNSVYLQRSGLTFLFEPEFRTGIHFTRRIRLNTIFGLTEQVRDNELRFFQKANGHLTLDMTAKFQMHFFANYYRSRMIFGFSLTSYFY